MLHDRGGDAVSAIDAARARFGPRADLVAPQAPRPCNPFQSNLRSTPEYAGFSWYLGEDAERPEPASFGDALAELEGFTAALARPFVITGRGQGAVLALTLGLHALPDFAGAVADSAGLATLEGWQPPADSLDGIEFVLGGLEESALTRTRTALDARRATIVAVEETGFVTWLDTLATRRTAAENETA